MSSEMRKIVADMRLYGGDKLEGSRLERLATHWADQIEAVLARTEAGADGADMIQWRYTNAETGEVLTPWTECDAAFREKRKDAPGYQFRELFARPQDAIGDAWKCYVGEMQTSAGMRYVVTVERESEQAKNFWDRTRITPYIFGDGERYKAEYEAACLSAFLNNTPYPDILAFNPDDAMQAKEAK